MQKVRDEAARRKSERKKKRRDNDEVTLATGHSAKGLEWRYVWGVGWSEEILPHRKADDIDEERRIAYVIATRARDQFVVSSLDTWNDTVVAPSRFLTGVQVASPVAQTEATDGEDAADALISPIEPEPDLGGLFLSL